MRPISAGWLAVRVLLAALMVGLSAAPPARADVTLPAVIGSHMVLQQETPISVWGWASPGEEIEITLGEMHAKTTADAEGEWLVKLPGLSASAEPLEMTIAGKNTIKLEDILVGEVWVGSGQSNMQWSVAASNNAQEEIASADYPKLRLFLVPLIPSGTPAKNVNARWQVCTPQTVPNFSAVSYFFGRELHKALDVPLGMIATSWGGTRIEPWTPPAGFESQPELERERSQIGAMQAGYQAALKAQRDKIRTWLAAADAAAASGQAISEPPGFPSNPFNNNGAPTGLYNGMVHPLVPFGIRGAIWYQGESNLGAGMHYHDLMKGLIQGWRTVWGQGEFPFLYVQLAPYKYGAAPTLLPEIWEAQTATLAFPNTGMAVVTDIANTADIHPRNKQETGRRLALWALAGTYGKNELVYSGPLYDSMVVEDGRVRLKFRHVGGGLKSRDGKPLDWFSIAGEDKKFVPAAAEIDGETVVVQSPQVAAPVAVRFGWHQLAEPNLCNQAGLPASPFRTDRWNDAINAEPAAE
ncbi:MAG TPA: sialate O-acetylesterase [Pirellulales bacterium]|nr:sialate O-acetylesterase [Pirellulales bacterium]